MADVLSVIQDVLNQDKQQKKEQAKIMREVNKKLKEKKGDKEEYMAFFKKTLDKYGVNSPAELSVADKKKFFNEIDAGWKGDDEKAEEVEEKESLGARVKARMEQEDDEEPEEDDDEDNDEPSEEEIDKIADLVVQKLKDKADEEEEKENEPDPTEAEGGKEEKIEIKPKMETIQNPHARSTWEEALRKVYTINEEVAPPIKPVIQSFGKKLHTYGKESGGMDKGLFMKIAKDAIGGKLPDPKFIQRQDTDPREFVLDMMAKEFGWKCTEQEYGVTFSNRRNYVEQVELDEAVLAGKDYKYDGKVVKISKKNFSKVHKDFKNSTKGKERMMINDPKTGGSISVPVQFEEVELDEKAKKIKQLHLFNTEKEAIKKAKEIGGQVAQNKRDGKYEAVIFEEVELVEKEVAVPPTIDNLKKIVKDKQNQIFMFKDGKARVDAFSASAMSQVYDALKPATKKKFEDMIKTKAGFMKSQAFAMKMLEGVEFDLEEDPDLEKIVKELENASKMHLGQSKRIQKHLDKMKKVEIKEAKNPLSGKPFEDLRGVADVALKIMQGQPQEVKEEDKETVDSEEKPQTLTE